MVACHELTPLLLLYQQGASASFQQEDLPEQLTAAKIRDLVKDKVHLFALHLHLFAAFASIIVHYTGSL